VRVLLGAGGYGGVRADETGVEYINLDTPRVHPGAAGPGHQAVCSAAGTNQYLKPSHRGLIVHIALHVCSQSGAFDTWHLGA